MALIFPQEYNWRPKEWKTLLGKEIQRAHTPLFGIEIETEYTRKDKLPVLIKEWGGDLINTPVFNPRNVMNAIYPLQELGSLINKLGFYAKRDGSLVEGFEIVSHPFSLHWLAENMGDLTALLRKMAALGFNSYDTGTCGMHIHVNRDSFLSPLHQWRFWLFFMQNYKFFHVLSKRDHASSAKYAGYYATPLKNLGTRIMNVPREAHHEAIEMQHKNSIEVRIFRGTLNCKTIVNEILLVNAIREYTGCSSVASQSIQGLLAWLTETYKPVTAKEVGGEQYKILFDQSENVATIKATLNRLAKADTKKISVVVSYGSAAAKTKADPVHNIQEPNNRWSNDASLIKPAHINMGELYGNGIFRTENGINLQIWNPNEIIVPAAYWLQNILHNWISKKATSVIINREGPFSMWYDNAIGSAEDYRKKMGDLMYTVIIEMLGGKQAIQGRFQLFKDGLYLWWPDASAAAVDAAYTGLRSAAPMVGFRIREILDSKNNTLALLEDPLLGEQYQPVWRVNRLGNWALKNANSYFQENLGIALKQRKYSIPFARHLENSMQPRISVLDIVVKEKKKVVKAATMNFNVKQWVVQGTTDTTNDTFVIDQAMIEQLAAPQRARGR